MAWQWRGELDAASPIWSSFNFDPKRSTIFIGTGKVGLQKVFGHVRGVEIDTVNAQPLHLIVNGASNDVAWGEFFLLVVEVHELGSIGSLKFATFPTECFGNQ